MTAELFARLLDRLPGAVSLSRIDPATDNVELLYLGRNCPEVYGLPESELRADPHAIRQRMAASDAAGFDVQVASAVRTLTPMAWSGQIRDASGGVRWIETRASFEREPDGSILVYSQGLDVSERRRTEDALVESERSRRLSDAMHRAVIEALPVGVAVMTPDGVFPITNAAQQAMTGGAPPGEKPSLDEISEAHGLFQADGITPLVMTDTPIVRVLSGEDAPDIEVVIRNGSARGEIRMVSQARPLRDDSGKIIAAVSVSMDVTAQRALEKELVTRNDQLAASEEAQLVLIDRLRAAVDELSNPILEVWDDVLAMPIIGIVDSRRAADMVRRLLSEVARTQASFVIVDLTGVEIVDTKTADHLLKLMRKVEIVGARCVLTGVRPAVAETLVDIGVDFGRLPTLRNLKHGLREALRHARREREGMRDIGGDDDPPGRIGTAPARS